jgi:glutathione S-transferase
MLTLYNADRCPFAARVRIVLGEKDVEYETVEIDLDDRPAWLYEKNPLGKVPVLEEDGRPLPESVVVMEFLEERYPEPTLLPADPADRAEVRLLVQRFDHLLGDDYYAYRRGDPNELAERLAQLPVDASTRYTLADIAYLPWAIRIRDVLGVELPPHVAAWLDARAERPAVAAELEVVAGLDRPRAPRGPSFGSVHVQSDDLPEVEKVVGRYVPLLRGRSEGTIVTPPRNGWIAVYDELGDREPEQLRRLAREISHSLGAVVLAIGVEEGAVAHYVLCERGRDLDEYMSVPEYLGARPSGEVVALAANPVLVERLTGADRQEIRAAAVQGSSPDELPPPAEILAAIGRAMRIEGADHGYAAAQDRSEVDNITAEP